MAPPLQPAQPTNPLLQLAKLAMIFVLAGLGSYLILTAPSQWQRLQYWVAHFGQPNQAEVYVDTTQAESFAGAVGAALRQPTFAKPTVEAGSDRDTTPQISSDLDLQENHLVIPKIQVKTPVIWNSSSNEKVMLANLQQGVAHYGFTSLPNPDSGNVFLTGHSSYYWWDPGKYKTVFTLLDRLVPGDQALIQYDGQIYVYQLREKLVVKPSDVSVTDPSPKSILSLMTCVPVGTSLNRLIARFDLAQVYAANGSPTPAETVTEPPPLPGQQVPTKRDIIRLLPGLR